MEKKNLKEVIAKIKEFVEGKISEKEIDEFGNSLNIRAYIPLMDKLRLAITIVSKQEYYNYEVLEIKMAEFYKDLFFDVLLKNYAMIEVDDEDCTYENYDLLYPVLGTWLLSYCGNDYNIVKEMIQDSMNLYNIKAINDSVGSISDEGIEKLIQENKNFMKTLEENKPVIEDLKDIMIGTDKNTKLAIESVRKEANKIAKERLKEKQKNTKTSSNLNRRVTTKNKAKKETNVIDETNE